MPQKAPAAVIRSLHTLKNARTYPQVDPPRALILTPDGSRALVVGRRGQPYDDVPGRIEAVTLLTGARELLVWTPVMASCAALDPRGEWLAFGSLNTPREGGEDRGTRRGVTDTGRRSQGAGASIADGVGVSTGGEQELDGLRQLSSEGTESEQR